MEKSAKFRLLKCEGNICETGEPQNEEKKVSSVIEGRMYPSDEIFIIYNQL